MRMPGAKAAFFNAVTILFGALTLFTVALVVGVASDALTPPIFVPATQAPPTLAHLPSPTPWPTWTPSNTPTPSPTPPPTGTPTATWTPTASATFTATPTRPTLAPSISPTRTRVPPTLTPTATPTPIPSATPNATPPSPTPLAVRSLSPYPFILQPYSLILRPNTLNERGCAWQGLAGLLTTAGGKPVDGVLVRVHNAEGSELTTLSGSYDVYGSGGWEITLGETPNAARYWVDLWANGVQVSPTVEVAFPGTCQSNLATLNFVQTRPLE